MAKRNVSAGEKRKIMKKVAGRVKTGLAARLRRKLFKGVCSSCGTGLPGGDGYLCRKCTTGGGGMNWMSLAEQEAWDALTPNEQARAQRGEGA